MIRAFKSKESNTDIVLIFIIGGIVLLVYGISRKVDENEEDILHF